MPLPSRRLYFVRHGHTDWNDAGRFQGHTDIPLNGRGRKDALAYAELLRLHFEALGREPAFARIVASPLLRARETAGILRRELGLSCPLSCDDRLKEQNYGFWEGLTLEEIDARFPGSVKRRFASLRTFAADGGESMASLKARVTACAGELPPDTLVVGHFGTLFALMLDLWPEKSAEFPYIGQDAFYILEGETILCAERSHPLGRPLLPR